MITVLDKLCLHSESRKHDLSLHACHALHSMHCTQVWAFSSVARIASKTVLLQLQCIRPCHAALQAHCLKQYCASAHHFKIRPVVDLELGQVLLQYEYVTSTHQRRAGDAFTTNTNCKRTSTNTTQFIISVEQAGGQAMISRNLPATASFGLESRWHRRVTCGTRAPAHKPSRRHINTYSGQKPRAGIVQLGSAARTKQERRCVSLRGGAVRREQLRTGQVGDRRRWLSPEPGR